MKSGWRKWLSEELHNLQVLPNIMRMMKINKDETYRCAACMGRRGNHTSFWRKCQNERDH
jgi:hypothetical protein